MKKWMKVLAAALIAALCMSCFAMTALAETKVTTTGNVNLRSGAGLSYESLAVVPKGTALTYSDAPVKDDRGVEWYKVTYSGKTGWVSSKYAKEGSSSSSSGSGKVTTTGNVNLRSGPGLDYASIGTIGKGKTVTYSGESQKDSRGVAWYKVTYNGKTGWISSKYSKEGSGSSGSGSGKVTTTGSVNLRSGPGLNYKSIGTIGKGKTASYLGSTQKDSRGVAWYKVSYNGKTGWVSSKYSKLK